MGHCILSKFLQRGHLMVPEKLELSYIRLQLSCVAAVPDVFSRLL